MKRLAIVSVVVWAAACGKETEPSSDEALLAAYRGAIPSEAQITAKDPQATVRAVGDPAGWPRVAGPEAVQINQAVLGIVRVMRAITNLQPTLFNSATKEFLWGPWANEDDYGTVAAYIKELGVCKDTPACAAAADCTAVPGCKEDFKYAYALLRGRNNDLTTMKPVIWGAATPDPTNEDNGVGVTLFDFEANFAFADANDPDFATKVFDRGRFVSVYGAADDAENPGARFGWVYAVFRNFIGKDKYAPGADPQQAGSDVDYLYGHYRGADGNVLDFLHFEVPLNIDNTATAALETLSVKMAFLNTGWGRAEVGASGGDLVAPAAYDETECWSAALNRTYLAQVYTPETGAPIVGTPEGTEQGCGPDVGGGVMLFARPLADLGIPTLDDVDQSMRAACESVAENGMQ
ncbi:MAG: hypothetical protein HY903_14105 [Deltaproteobacteria bacterium]|nr:hypothetical protein [Deltaproteobacteria bacterium]